MTKRDETKSGWRARQAEYAKARLASTIGWMQINTDFGTLYSVAACQRLARSADSAATDAKIYDICTRWARRTWERELTVNG